VTATHTPTAELSPPEKRPAFEVRLANFTGPFDLLLGLITKHQLDITEVALATVTDEFIRYIKGLQALGEEWALDEASEFKHVAGMIGSTLDLEGRRFPRQVALEEHFSALLPELVWRHTPQQFAALAEAALKPKEAAPTEVGLAHLHGSPVSVKEQADLLGRRLRQGSPLTFRALTADAESSLVVVARFLALLEMFRDRVVSFDQLLPLGDLTVHWTAGSEAWSSESLSEEYEEQP
jgi:segregation and condensation protein A